MIFLNSNFHIFFFQFHPFTTTGVAPTAVLIVLNLRICRGIRVLHQRRTKRNRRELNMAYIAIAIVSLFVISNVPRYVLRYSYEVCQFCAKVIPFT